MIKRNREKLKSYLIFFSFVFFSFFLFAVQIEEKNEPSTNEAAITIQKGMSEEE